MGQAGRREVTMFVGRYRVRSTQVDQLGHLNNAAFLEIFEWARWESTESGDFPFTALMDEQGIGPVIVHADVTFRREVRFHEHVRVTVEFSKTEGKRGVIRQEIIRESDGEVAAVALFTFVMIDLALRRVVPMPAELLEAAERTSRDV